MLLSFFAPSDRASREDDSEKTACKNQDGFDNRLGWWSKGLKEGGQTSDNPVVAG